ncbi:MAG TPA: HlyD family secretion protein [Phycisphaerae bacterium]|nr:HlyD family secretion protein [Phycisphaerae bacterium]
MTTLLEKPEPKKPARRTPGSTAPALESAPAESVVAPSNLAESPSIPAVEEPRAAKMRLPVKRLLLAAVALAALVGGGAYGYDYWKWASVHETTDDAFVDGHVTQVTPRIAGHVLKVNITDNQVVQKGDVLVELDPKDYEAVLAEAQGKLTAAQADLVATQSQVEQARAQITTAEAQVEQAKADAASRQAECDRASLDLKNYANAQKSGVVSEIELRKVQTEVLTTQATLDAARKAVAATEAQVAEAKATLAAREGLVAVSRAGITTAEAAVRTATLNLSYTKIVAATDGRVTKKNVEPGDYVLPAQMPALLGLVNNNVWVTANFKETQLAHMHAGQPVDVEVDAYPGVKFHGHVDSIQQGAGAYFSLLPPENATGNYVKVVQRVPVKIELESPDPRYLLGPGMSVVPDVEIAAK